MESILEPKLHYHLVSGKVTFRLIKDDGAEDIGIMELNAIIKTEENRVILHDLGKAQLGLQSNFRKKIPNPEIEVIDTVIIAISHLCHATESEYMTTPNGNKITEESNKMETKGDE